MIDPIFPRRWKCPKFPGDYIEQTSSNSEFIWHEANGNTRSATLCPRCVEVFDHHKTPAIHPFDSRGRLLGFKPKRKVTP